MHEHVIGWRTAPKIKYPLSSAPSASIFEIEDGRKSPICSNIQCLRSSVQKVTRCPAECDKIRHWVICWPVCSDALRERNRSAPARDIVIAHQRLRRIQRGPHFIYNRSADLDCRADTRRARRRVPVCRRKRLDIIGSREYGRRSCNRSQSHRHASCNDTGYELRVRRANNDARPVGILQGERAKGPSQCIDDGVCICSSRADAHGIAEYHASGSPQPDGRHCRDIERR